VITSAQNPKLKLVRTLMGRARDRREENAFVIEGIRLVEEALAAGWPIQFVLYSDGLTERGQHLVNTILARQISVDEVAGDLLQKLSDTEAPQGILAVLDFNELPLPSSPAFLLIPDQVRDPGNLGTLLRSAAATGVQAVLLPPETTDAFAPKVLRSGMGAHFRLPVHSMLWEEIAEISTSASLQIYLADMDGTSCWETDLRQPLALVIGGEAQGASEEAHRLASLNISIPMIGGMESLNAGVAGSVLMFEILRQRTTMAPRNKPTQGHEII
jgi:TrmH family RNA methyltransferase